MGPTVDLDALDALICGLTRLKHNGGHLDPGSDWLGDPSAHFALDLQNPPPFRQSGDLHRSWSQISVQHNVLCDICQFVARFTSQQKQRYSALAREDGIRRAPDDLLACIFEEGHASEDDSSKNSFALAVSGVSRRFRSIALRLPVLWSKLSPSRVPEKTQVYLTRAKSPTPLFIYLPEPWENGDDDISRFLKDVDPHHDRFFRLTIHPSNLDLFHAHLRPLIHTHLTYFTELVVGTEDYPNFDRIPLPKLLRFSGNPSKQGFIWPSTLTCCTFKLDMERDILELVHVLPTLNSIQFLSLEFSNQFQKNRVDLPPLILAKGTRLLPALSSLSIVVTDDVHINQVIFFLMSMRPFSLLNDLTFKVPLSQFSAVNAITVLTCLRGPLSSYPLLRALHLHCTNSSYVLLQNVGSLLHNMPSLEHLDIEDARIDKPEYHPMEWPPCADAHPLRSIVLRSHHGLDLQSFVPLAHRFVDTTQFPHFEIFRIDSDCQFDIGMLNTLEQSFQGRLIMTSPISRSILQPPRYHVICSSTYSH